VTIKCPSCHSDNPDTSRFCAECGTKLIPTGEISPTKTLETAQEELSTGSVFAQRYQIIEELGKGGMGHVYKVLDKKINEKIALKLIKPEIASDKKTIERFRNELKFARRIRHSNVCQMFDLGEEGGTHFITMEYVPGEDLKSMIRMSGQLGVGTTIKIARQICEGLAEAHRLGVVHRDLKPQNIMIDREGKVRIMDFGIARSLKAKGITGAGVIIGTPEYMSPEQVEGKEVDQRSDIYSLGVILYEMVTGKVLFEGDTPLSIAFKHKTEAPRDTKEVNPQIPEELSQLILKCLEKDRERRFQSAEQVLSALINIEKGIPLTERAIPRRKPLTSKEITVTIGLKKLFIPGLVLIALIITGVIIWRPFTKKEITPPPSGKPSLAIMYFKNNTGDENLEHLRTMIPDLLIADLIQSKHIRVLSAERMYNILSELNLMDTERYSSKDLKEIASRGRVGHVLVGNYAKAGDIIRINITLQAPGTEEVLGSETVEGKGQESIFSMVDELTRKIKAKFKLSEDAITSDIDRGVGQITTSSIEAYRYYSDGMKYNNKGDYRGSVPFFEKAVAIDPEFAMAYQGMAVAYLNLGYTTKVREYIQRALDLSERVSDRERYRILGSFYLLSEKTYDKAIEACEKLLRLYPEDYRGNLTMGNAYYLLEEWDKAIERYETLKQIQVESSIPYGNLADVYGAKGLYDKAVDVLEYYLDNISDNARIHRHLSYAYLSQKKYDLAFNEADKSLALDPLNYLIVMQKGDLFHLKGDLIQAEEEYRKLLETKEKTAHLYGRKRLGALYVLQGRLKDSRNEIRQGIKLSEELGDKEWQSMFYLDSIRSCLGSGKYGEALKECNMAWDAAAECKSAPFQITSLYYKGRIYLEMKSLNSAQKTADELRDRIREGLNKKMMRYYYHLKGMIEMDKQKFSKGIEYFKKAIAMLSFEWKGGDEYYYPDDNHALFIDPLAYAYYKTGDLDKAREEYEKIISLSYGRLHHGDIYAKSFHMLGKIYEEKGWKGKAMEHYEKFLDLWKDAEPGVSEIEEAKKRLLSLQSL